MFSFLDSGLFTWVVLPVLIFLARICDVSLGTIRVIFVSPGYRYLAPVLGFSSVLLEDLPAGSPSREDAEEIRRAAVRARDLTQRLLAMSRKRDLRI